MTKKRVDEVIARADLAISDLTTDGGLLLPEQANAFIDEVQEQPTLLNEARVIRMNSPTRKINAIGFASRIMKVAPQAGGYNDDGSNDRTLTEANRSKPATRQVELVSKEVMAEVHLPYEVLEDNIEQGNLETHIIRLIAQRAALDLEEWVIRGDTASGDPYLALNDGLLKAATSNVVDVLAAGVSPNVFRDAQLAMPQRYLRNLAAMRTYITVQDEIRYRSVVATRGTGYGDSALQTNQELQAYGVPLRKTPMMTANFGLFTYPQNIIFGIHRDILIETERNIRSRQLVVVLSTRVDVKYEDEEAVVKIINMN